MSCTFTNLSDFVEKCFSSLADNDVGLGRNQSTLLALQDSRVLLDGEEHYRSTSSLQVSLPALRYDVMDRADKACNTGGGHQNDFQPLFSRLSSTL